MRLRLRLTKIKEKSASKYYKNANLGEGWFDQRVIDAVKLWIIILQSENVSHSCTAGLLDFDKLWFRRQMRISKPENSNDFKNLIKFLSAVHAVQVSPESS